MYGLKLAVNFQKLFMKDSKLIFMRAASTTSTTPEYAKQNVNKQNSCRHRRAYASSNTGLLLEDLTSSNNKIEDELDFENVESVFESKSKAELLRSMFVLKICSYNFMVNNSLKLMELGKMILGRKLFSSLMGASFYGQFVAGDTSQSVGKTVASLEAAGIRSMLHITAEECADSSDKEKWFDENVSKVMECYALQAEHCSSTRPRFTQIKLSSFFDVELLKKLNVILLENGRMFDNTSLVNYKNLAEGLDGNLKSIPQLTTEENQSLLNALQRLNRLGQKSVEQNVLMMVDAEYYNTCSIMAMLTFSLMSKFNREKILVMGTYQALLRQTFDSICMDAKLAERNGFGFGFKLVRGAYLQSELQLAIKHGYPAPTNESYEETNRMYTKCMEYAIRKVHKSPKGKFTIMFATHNEDSVKNAVRLMKEAGIDKDSEQVFFGQIFGLCDYVTYALGKAKYPIYKSIPYGPTDDVMPYMSRRAIENKSVFARLGKEKRLVSQAFKNKILQG